MSKLQPKVDDASESYNLPSAAWVEDVLTNYGRPEAPDLLFQAADQLDQLHGHVRELAGGARW